MKLLILFDFVRLEILCRTELSFEHSVEDLNYAVNPEAHFMEIQIPDQILYDSLFIRAQNHKQKIHP